MADGQGDQSGNLSRERLARIRTVAELGAALRQLRRRHARQRGVPELTYRELAAKTGWSYSIIGEYLAGKTLPPTDRFDDLARLLGADPAELGGLATARDRVDERRRAPTGPADAGPRRAGGPPPARVVPRQLPPAVRHFAGRSAELEALTDLMKDAAGAVVISAIDGTAGIGKTALAVTWAHEVADRFPDGQLYVNLRGFDPGESAMTAAAALRGFLDAFDVPPHRVPDSLDAQVGLYRSLLAGRRMLVLLDNARDAAQVRPLLPGAPGCFVVVTSRNRLTGLVAADDAHPLALGMLTETEAEDLLVRRLGRPRVAAEPAAVDSIVARSGRLPLALVILAARAATEPGTSLAELAARLHDARASLDVLTAGDPATDMRAVFSWSYEALGVGAARLFRLLGLFPGPDLAAPAAASLAGIPVEAAEPLLTELAQANLATEPAVGRYGMHDLLRAYALDLVRWVEPPAERDRALRRLLDHYLHTAYAADRVLNPHRDPIALPEPAPAVAVDDPADPERALAWFAAAHRALLTAVHVAADAGLDVHAWQLAWSLATHLDRRGHWHEWAATQHTALRAAQRLADHDGQAHAHRGIAAAYTRLGRHPDARRHQRHLLDLFAARDDRAGQAHAHRGIGVSYERQGRYADALRHARRALGLYEALADEAGQANALNEVGWYHRLLGDYDDALAYGQRALALHRRIGNRYGEASALDSLGCAHRQLGDHAQAIDRHREALFFVRELGVRYYEADVLGHLASAYADAGAIGAARDAWQQALVILDQLGHQDAESIRAELRRSDVTG